MRIPRPSRRPRLPRRSARLRLTAMYAVAFLVCGGAVLTLTYLLYGQTSAYSLPLDHPSATFKGYQTVGVPAAEVRQEGSYDVFSVPSSFKQVGPYKPVRGVLKIPAALATRMGSYDEFRISYVPQRIRYVEIKVPATAVNQLGHDITDRVSYDKRRIVLTSAIALAVIAVAAAAIGWVIAGRVLRPLSTITAAARRIAASSLHERLGLHGPDDELKELADTLDNLFARLEASFDAQRRFAANASHELRTPLTRERALLQVTLADPASTVSTWRAVSRELLASNEETERLIEALLTLASSETGIGRHEPLDLAAIAAEVLAVPRAGTGHLGLNVSSGITPAALDGDPLLVRRLVTNLVDNAVRHNVPGGHVLVTTLTRDGRAVLSVANSGQVIPAAEVDRLFQPFQRLGPRSARRDGGSGLGLSIVRAIAAAHGADVVARAMPAGGLAVDVVFRGRPAGARTPCPEGLPDLVPAAEPSSR